MTGRRCCSALELPPYLDLFDEKKMCHEKYLCIGHVAVIVIVVDSERKKTPAKKFAKQKGEKKTGIDGEEMKKCP